MTDHKRPTGKPPAKELLDELQSVQSLLNDPGASKADWHDDVPTLGGDNDKQIPLLKPEGAAPTDASASLRQAIAARENPFLSKAAAALPRNPTTSKTSPADKPASSAAKADPAQIRELVDTLIAEWLPRIERELRARLIERLSRDSQR